MLEYGTAVGPALYHLVSLTPGWWNPVCSNSWCFFQTGNLRREPREDRPTSRAMRCLPCPWRTTRSGSWAWTSTGSLERSWAEWFTSSNHASPRYETPTRTRSKSTSRLSNRRRCGNWSDTSNPVCRKNRGNPHVSATLWSHQRLLL